jgi:hypothetical protein
MLRLETKKRGWDGEADPAGSKPAFWGPAEIVKSLAYSRITGFVLYFFALVRRHARVLMASASARSENLAGRQIPRPPARSISIGLPRKESMLTRAGSLGSAIASLRRSGSTGLMLAL